MALSSDAPSEVQTTIDKALALGTLSGEALRSWLYAAAEAGFKSALSTSAASAPSARAVAEKCAEIAANAEAQQLPMHSSAREDILAYAASLPSESGDTAVALLVEARRLLTQQIPFLRSGNMDRVEEIFQFLQRSDPAHLSMAAHGGTSDDVQRDAARYRFIKDERNDDLLMQVSMEIPSADWDAAIDAAMSSQSGKEQL